MADLTCIATCPMAWNAEERGQYWINLEKGKLTSCTIPILLELP
jgi:hypothetical protein